MLKFTACTIVSRIGWTGGQTDKASHLLLTQHRVVLVVSLHKTSARPAVGMNMELAFCS